MMAKADVRGAAMILLRIAVASVFVGAAACGEETTAPQGIESPISAAFPVTVHVGNGDVQIDRSPARIVSLSASVTEMLFAIGAGEQVIAADEYSNYPAAAPTTKLSGFEPNVEAIAKFEPDLVIIYEDRGDLDKALSAIDIPVLLTPPAETLQDTYSQMSELGRATGHSEEAEDLVASMKADMKELAQSVEGSADQPTYYHELTESYYSATSDTFIGEVYAMAGLRNIADGAKKGGEYPQLSAEFIIDADPDIIFLADTKCCGQSSKTVVKRPGWDTVTAVKRGAVVELDDDIASRWGPRIVDFFGVVVDAVAEAHADRD